jgi:hypothetical protein
MASAFGGERRQQIKAQLAAKAAVFVCQRLSKALRFAFLRVILFMNPCAAG